MTSHGVDSDIYPEASWLVPQQGSNVILKQISDAVEFHDVTRFLAQPKLVKFYEKVTVKMMEMA